jgi:hypothetical protein
MVRVQIPSICMSTTVSAILSMVPVLGRRAADAGPRASVRRMPRLYRKRRGLLWARSGTLPATQRMGPAGARGAGLRSSYQACLSGPWNVVSTDCAQILSGEGHDWSSLRHGCVACMCDVFQCLSAIITRARGRIGGRKWSWRWYCLSL